MRKRVLQVMTLTIVVVLASLAAQPALAETNKRPNIVIIMADDMGYSDIGCYGGEIATPNLDSLASRGVRFTQFYNTGRCCPTRAALLTGLYSHQAGVGAMMTDRGLDGYRGNLNRRCRTIAEVLRPAGYRTYVSGKWHVTRHVGPDGPKHNWPIQRGFDRFFGTIHGAGSFFDPNSLTRDNTQILPGSDDFFYTDAINDTASQFVTDHKSEHSDQPFFMYVAHTAPHWPLHARVSDYAKYAGRYDAGWDELRKERHQRQIEMGLLSDKWKMTARHPGIKPWKEIEEKDRPWFTRRMEVYAAQIAVMDEGIGRLVETLKKNGQYENTLILFLADNGGCAEEAGTQGPVREARGDSTEKPLGPNELQTRMTPFFARDGRPVRQGFGVMPGGPDTFGSYGHPWANASNTPFRLYKHYAHEGGISSPLIAHWPAGIDASRHGIFERQQGHLIDLMATCIDLSGAEYPSVVDDKAIHPYEGISLRPAFAGDALDRGRPLFWEHTGHRAIRDGKWKLVAQGADNAWELYDMEADRTELNNLANTEPERAAQMATAWEAWAKRVGAKPWPWGKKK